MDLIYIRSIQEIVNLHNTIIQISGGKSGIKSIDSLESVLENIQNDDYYPEFEQKLTHLVFSVNKFHAFQDGNKRTSIAVGALFLERNGFDYLVSKFILEMENIAVCVADNVIDKEMLEEIIFSILYEDDYAETLKIRLTQALYSFHTKLCGSNDDGSLF